MKLQIENKIISSITLPNGEYAWKMDEVLLVLEYMRSGYKIVLGGDVLDSNLQYTYDNWFYNVNHTQDTEVNSAESILIAQKYISHYIKSNGNNYHVVIVVA